MAKALVMGFITDEGGKASIKLNKIKDPLSGSEVSLVMDDVITSDVFFTSTGKLVKANSAKIVETTETDLDIE